MNIIIIGATSGIGNELWKLYASGKNKVIAIGRRKPLLQQMQKEHPDNTMAVEADMVQTVEMAKCIDGIFAAFSRVDVAIVCAGTGDLNPDLQFEKEAPAIQTNVVGWTSAIDHLYNNFQRQGSGHLVTITSVGGLTGAAAAPAYSATKAYQINYTQALRKKSHKTGIHVTEIRPGLVDTAMAKGEGLFWVMPAQKVARQIASAIARKRSVVVVTKRWRIISFLLKHFL